MKLHDPLRDGCFDILQGQKSLILFTPPALSTCVHALFCPPPPCVQVYKHVVLAWLPASGATGQSLHLSLINLSRADCYSSCQYGRLAWRMKPAHGRFVFISCSVLVMQKMTSNKSLLHKKIKSSSITGTCQNIKKCYYYKMATGLIICITVIEY